LTLLLYVMLAIWKKTSAQKCFKIQLLKVELRYSLDKVSNFAEKKKKMFYVI
jgi:hypothetical protein